MKWELDHIIPVSYVLKEEFKVKSQDEQQKIKQQILHYTNIKLRVMPSISSHNLMQQMVFSFIPHTLQFTLAMMHGCWVTWTSSHPKVVVSDIYFTI